MNQPIIKFTTLYLFSLGFKRYLANFREVKKLLVLNSLIKLEVEGSGQPYKNMALWFNTSIFNFFAYWHLRRFKRFIKRKLSFLNNINFKST